MSIITGPSLDNSLTKGKLFGECGHSRSAEGSKKRTAIKYSHESHGTRNQGQLCM
jgi:hypothetical protein